MKKQDLLQTGRLLTTFDAHRRQWLTHAAAGLAGAAIGAPTKLAAAQASGSRDTVQELAWTDAARNRRLPLLMRWPNGNAPCALVIYSHGLGGSRHGGAAWGGAWCDAGFAVLHLQHPGSDSDIFGGGAAGLYAAASGEQLVNRAADVRFVLDELERQLRIGLWPWQRLRLDAVGVAGHSFGAATTLAVAGQRYPLAGDVSDPRPKAFIAFSPTPGRGTQTLSDSFGAIKRPVLVMTGSLDGDPLDGGRDPTRRDGRYRASVYEGLPPGQRALLWLQGADHMTFGGGRAGDGDRDARFLGRFTKLRREAVTSELEATHHALIRRQSLGWWHAQLLGDADAAAVLRGPAARVGLAEQDRWVMD